MFGMAGLGPRVPIHPRKPHREGHSPDTDSVRIAWNVFVASLNDLAAAKNT